MHSPKNTPATSMLGRRKIINCIIVMALSAVLAAISNHFSQENLVYIFAFIGLFFFARVGLHVDQIIRDIESQKYSRTKRFATCYDDAIGTWLSAALEDP